MCLHVGGVSLESLTHQFKIFEEKRHNMSSKTFQFGATILLLVLSTAALCFAQSDTARLQGTITDAQGAAVSSATVTVTSTETGWQSTATTNDLRLLLGSGASAGKLSRRSVAKRLQESNQGLRIAGGAICVADFQLEIGTQTETVEVRAGAPVLDAEDSAIGAVLEARQIEEMPLNGRNFTQLALLVPGVIRGSGNATGSSGNAETFRYGQEGGASLVVNGIRAQANNFILDGIDNNEALVNTIVIFPPADAIDEFRVQTNIAPAQYGRAGGALVVTSIKSGTNDYHGSVFWFNRNKELNAKNFFSSGPTPGFVRNQFGGQRAGRSSRTSSLSLGIIRDCGKPYPADHPTRRCPRT